MTEKMEHTQRCPRCLYVGPMDYVAGHFICPKCMQIPDFGDCCQGEQTNANKKEETKNELQ